MRVVIYESSSFGGCYAYSRALLDAYRRHPDVSEALLLLPTGSPGGEGVLPILINDRPAVESTVAQRSHFIYRQLVNPLLLWRFLRRLPPAFVLLNDFEQLSAPAWAPLFRRTLCRHRFGVFLHDPDRDAYPPSPGVSARSMRTMMATMDLALTHEHRPEKSYYQPNGRTKYREVPHGLYPLPPPDQELAGWLQEARPHGTRYVTIPGNIRDEKNYERALRALAQVPEATLLVAGAPSHSGVTTDRYRALATELGVGERTVWIERFLTDAELAAVVEVSEVIMMNYARSFTSQSGILNVIAPLKKKLIVSDADSALARTVHRFELGPLIDPDRTDALVMALCRTLDDTTPAGWNAYLNYASWDRQVQIVLAALRDEAVVPA
ncbi:MAG: glycosyltransferase [Catalinimonas sp.]